MEEEQKLQNTANMSIILLWSGYSLFILNIVTGLYYDLKKQLNLKSLNPGNVLHGIILVYSIWLAVIVHNVFSHYNLHLIGLYIGVPILMIIWTKFDHWIHIFYIQCISIK